MWSSGSIRRRTRSRCARPRAWAAETWASTASASKRCGRYWKRRSKGAPALPRGRRVALALRGDVALVRRGVVDVIERRHEIHLDPAELALEGADVLPRMVRLVFRRDPPEVVPLAAHRLGAAHDLEMQEIRRHGAPVEDEGRAEEIRGLAAQIRHQRGREPPAAVFGEEKRRLPPGRSDRKQGAEVARGLRRDFLPRRHSPVDPQEIREAPRRGILDDGNAVPLRDADVVPALGLHLSEDLLLRRAQIDVESVPRLHVVVLVVRGLESLNETRGTPPPGLDPQMADRFLFRLAVLRDALEDRLEHLPGGRLVLGKHRTVLHVIKGSAGGVRPLRHQRAPDDGILVFECDPEVPVSHGRAKMRPPRRLHETGIRRRLQEPVPRVPPFQFMLELGRRHRHRKILPWAQSENPTPCSMWIQTFAVMIRQDYGRSNAEFITRNKTSIILTHRRKGARNDGAPPASQGQGTHTQRFRSRDLFCLFLKKGNHMRNLNTEELKQVYGGGGGSCASASKSRTGSKSGGTGSKSGTGSKTNAS